MAGGSHGSASGGGQQQQGGFVLHLALGLWGLSSWILFNGACLFDCLESDDSAAAVSMSDRSDRSPTHIMSFPPIHPPTLQGCGGSSRSSCVRCRR